MPKVVKGELYTVDSGGRGEHFGIGAKQIRKILLDNPEMSIWHGNKWMLIREDTERFFANLLINEECIRE